MIDGGYTLQNLQNLNVDNGFYKQQIPFTNIRARAVKEAAESLGMQSGLYVESKAINKRLQQHQRTLDTLFNFNLLIYHQNVLPPVIEQGNASLKIGATSDTLNIAGTTYNIIKQVRFVTTPPTWRTYLDMNYKKPELPNKVLLPKDSAERTVWKAALKKGWQEGINQGISIFKINLNRLVRDYNGMVLYKSLLARQMVSPFYVSAKNNGITGDASHMVIDDHSMHIDTKPQLQLHSKIWQPVVVDNPPNVVSSPPDVVDHSPVNPGDAVWPPPPKPVVKTPSKTKTTPAKSAPKAHPTKSAKIKGSA